MNAGAILINTVIMVVTAMAQAAPNVQVNSTIIATAGTLTCTATPNQPVPGTTPSSIHVVCTVGNVTVHTSDSTVPSTPGTGIAVSVTSGTNAVTWLVSKGNPIPDQWQVAATDGTTTVTKSGSF